MQLLREEYALHGYPFPERDIGERLGWLLHREELGAVWLLKDAGRVAGLLVLTYGFDLEFGGRLAVITDLYVRKRHRRKGVGAAAVRFAERFCRARGMAAIELQVEGANESARLFYQRMGFAWHDRVPMTKRLAEDRPRSRAV